MTRQHGNPHLRSAVAPAVELSGCEGALARVLQLAGALSLDNKETRGHLPSGRAAQTGASEPGGAEAKAGLAGEQLMAALRELAPEVALKIRTLMIAGRDGQSISDVKVNLSLSDADAGFAAMATDSGENGPLLVDYLRRGYALACAMDLNLDSPLADWQSPAASDSDERAWQSFGRQLASSLARDWQFLSIIEPPSVEISRLYLRQRQGAWWSFQDVLDRPTPAAADEERRVLAERGSRIASTGTLETIAEALLAQHQPVQGRALRRASRAICARMGKVRAALDR